MLTCSQNLFVALLNRMPKTINDSTRLNAIFYGSYVGASLSIGFLFMSGGTKTFDTSNESGAFRGIIECFSVYLIKLIILQLPTY